MKILNHTALGLGASLFLIFLPDVSHGQGIATDVIVYTYSCAVPNTLTAQEFVTARDQFMKDLKTMGRPVATGSRVGHTSAIEVRNVYEAREMCVSSTATLWRGKFDLAAPYNLRGGRIYNPSVIMGKDGKISLSRLDHIEICTITNYNSSNSLAGLDYSVSRVGVLAGLDGVLFTADDVYLETGSGTNLVDAIVFSGGRIGSEVGNQTDINNLKLAISQLSNGVMSVTFEYRYVLSPGHFVSHSSSVKVYADGTIPTALNQVVFLPTPNNGTFFSFVGPENASATLVSGVFPKGPWSPIGSPPGEGASTWSGNVGQGFFMVQPMTSALVMSRLALASQTHYSDAPLVSSPSTDADQDIATRN